MYTRMFAHLCDRNVQSHARRQNILTITRRRRIYMHDTSPTVPCLMHARPLCSSAAPHQALKSSQTREPESKTFRIRSRRLSIEALDTEKLPFLLVPTIRGNLTDLLAEPRELRCILDFFFVMRNDMFSAVCRACRLCLVIVRGMRVYGVSI